MAVDKLVDSTQLDSDLTSVANAIRTKGGTNSQMAFPSGFVSAIQSLPNTPTLISKSITQNGTYTASSDNADGYSSITVTVSGGGSLPATQHSILLEFSDTTSTIIPVYYNDSLISSMITSYKPVTYSSKTVSLAQLDNVTWYQPVVIPTGTELVDYTKVTNGKYIGQDGAEHESEWSVSSDYIDVDSGMTFSYTAYYWYYIGVYDENKTFLRSVYVMNDGTQDPNDTNTGHGTLSGNTLTNAKYVRLCGQGASSTYMSLIRTA